MFAWHGSFAAKPKQASLSPHINLNYPDNDGLNRFLCWEEARCTVVRWHVVITPSHNNQLSLVERDQHQLILKIFSVRAFLSLAFKFPCFEQLPCLDLCLCPCWWLWIILVCCCLAVLWTQRAIMTMIDCWISRNKPQANFAHLRPAFSCYHQVVIGWRRRRRTAERALSSNRS